jgi:hypothetical protein
MKSIRLREGKERSLLRRHPWVFEGSIARGSADAGELVRVEAADGRFLAWGAYSPSSSIRVRAWSFDEAQRIDASFFTQRLQQAIALRARLGIASDGQRLVHESCERLRIMRSQPHVFIEIEAAPADREGSTLRGIQAGDPGTQGAIDRLHGASCGQAQHRAALQCCQQLPGHHISHRLRIGPDLQAQPVLQGQGDPATLRRLLGASGCWTAASRRP